MTVLLKQLFPLPFVFCIVLLFILSWKVFIFQFTSTRILMWFQHSWYTFIEQERNGHCLSLIIFILYVIVKVYIVLSWFYFSKIHLWSLNNERYFEYGHTLFSVLTDANSNSVHSPHTSHDTTGYQVGDWGHSLWIISVYSCTYYLPDVQVT